MQSYSDKNWLAFGDVRKLARSAHHGAGVRIQRARRAALRRK